MRTPEKHTAADGTETWKVRFRHGISPRTGKPLQTSEPFDDETEALRFCRLLDDLGPARALATLHEDRDATAPGTTLNEVAAAHIKHLTGIEEGTRLDYTRTWARTWGPLIGSLEVAPETVNKDAIATAVNQLEQRYSPKSMKNHRGLLSSVLTRAVEEDLLKKNPAKGVRLSAVTIDPDAEDDSMTLLSMPEFEILSRQFTGIYYNLVRFLAGTGCRWGEATVLRKMDFDFTGDQPLVRIRRALKRSGDGATVIRGPKTKRSRRTIVVPRHLVPELTELMDGKKAGDLIFVGPRGAMIKHHNFWSGIWRPAIWRAQRCADHYLDGCRCGGSRPKTCKLHPDDELPEPCGCDGTLSTWLRIHDLRHTHASWLLAAGIPIHVVSRRLGHESIQTTVDRYAHLLPDAQLAAAEAADAAFLQLPGAEIERQVAEAMAGLDALLAFLTGGGEVPPKLEAALIARGWAPPASAAIEA
ncbi:MAG TPA: site-specific integrase [Kribbella sp.]|nr:site-specific integrase [Kribbella sp.]